MKVENKQKIYNIVNSVKGGCGKTTLSIWLATYLENFAPDTIKGESCLIDMDLQGSCMVSLFHGSDEIEQQYHYLHELIRGYDLKGKQFIQSVNIGTKHFSAVFTSPKQEDKNMFYSGAQSNYNPVMECGTFRLGIKSFLKSEQVKKRKFRHVIFDMPPNADGYSDAALECVLNPRYSVLDSKNKDKVNLFMMMTLDVSHMQSTINKIKEMYAETNNKVPDKIFFVFNNNIISNLNDDQCVSLYQSKRKKIENALKMILLSEEQRKKVYFCIMHQNIEYAGICAEGMGLSNQTKDFMMTQPPFSKYACFEDGDFAEMTPNVFSELMNGEQHGSKN